jgi:hypothetical protein
MNVLAAALKPRKDGSEEKKGQSTGYEIQELFKKIQSNPEVDQDRLAALEWQYLCLATG